MSVTFDVNVLVYAADTLSPFHERARDTLISMLEGNERVHLFWPTLAAFVRITTSRAILREPLSVDGALEAVELLVADPRVSVSGEPDGFWTAFKHVVGEVGARGNLVSDAHLVALMRTVGVRDIVTRDRDFRKFDWVRVIDPFHE